MNSLLPSKEEIEETVYEYIKTFPGKSRHEIATHLFLPTTTVGLAIRSLTAKGLIEKTDTLAELKI
jgi:DNA-binding MarR family transcriptional regulator